MTATTTTDAPETVDLSGMTNTTDVGPTERQIDHWTRAGYLHPLERHNPTSGCRRRWPVAEQRIAATIARLAAAGMTVPRAAELARRAAAEATAIRNGAPDTANRASNVTLALAPNLYLTIREHAA
jgi:hypothetical protein